ncbi:MAG: hypothetical protein BJ554DRAFT_3748 [Olpidium bornovanus]|uniref:Yippee domain-containing protein n=1 Tax=Olpidium bornovanus TaxID=278681 RepID=A0A8H7ZNB1_9FUNG|nr:MAG: hypothetical protein BJ554DRAFT_3748 [Olpidium bornovanus]
MGLQHNTYLAGHVFGCNQCYTHLSTNEEIISKVKLSFQGQHGRAFLFKTVVNVTEGPREERCMTTGRHVVRNIYCRKCGCVVGWKYVSALRAFSPPHTIPGGNLYKKDPLSRLRIPASPGSPFFFFFFFLVTRALIGKPAFFHSFSFIRRMLFFFFPDGQEKAYDETQRYKEGHFILEKELLAVV